MKTRRVVTARVWPLVLGGALLAACGGDTIGDTIILPAPDGGENDATVPTLDGSPGTGTTSDAATDSSAGDDDSSTGPGSDASASDAASTDAGDAGDAGPTDGGFLDGATVYAGQTASLSVPTGATSYSWTLTSAPAGSTITQASIGNPTAATATLPTDIPGTYSVAVTVSQNNASATDTFVVTAAAAHLVFAVGTTANTVGLTTVDSDGTNGHAVSCAFAGQTAQTASKGALGFVDLREGAPGTATKIIFASPSVQDAGSGGYSSQLFATDTNGTCPDGGGGGADAGVIAQVNGVNGSSYNNIAHPRLSPDGTKVAFTATSSLPGNPDTLSTVNVVNIDGTSLVTLGTVGEPVAANSNDTTGYTATFYQPEWTTDGTEVGWMRAEKSDAGAAFGWNLVTSAVPAGGSDPQVYISCPTATTTPKRAVFLADKRVITTASVGGVTDLVVLQKPTTASNTCNVEHDLSSLQPTQAVTSFAVSPDLTLVAFVASSMMTGNVIYVASTDGTTVPAHPVGNVSTLDAANGLRWVAGGSQLAFTHPTDAGVNAVSTAWALGGDASVVTDVASPDAGQTYTAVGDGDYAGCSFGGKSAPVIGFFAGALAFLGIARRRQRRNRNDVVS